MAVVIRKSWPRITVVKIKGQTYYRVDARRQGTGGKREHFVSRDRALKRATELDSDQRSGGDEAVAFPAELRAMALRCSERLAEFGKTLEDATTQFVKALKRQKIINDSRVVGELAYEWIDSIRKGKRPHAKGTIDDLCKHRGSLRKHFGKKKIVEITQRDIEDALWEGEFSSQTRKNRLVKWGQFFNWSIRQGYCDQNPCKGLKIDADPRKIERYSADQIERLLRLAEDKYPALVPYLAVCTFAGVRPFECERLDWSDFNFEGHPPDIEVRKTTYLVKDRTRYAEMSNNLVSWLKKYKKEKGCIIERNHRKRMDDLKVEFGFRLKGKNPDGLYWIDDGLRHTFASFWLGKHPGEDAKLASLMGNTPDTITNHYNRPVRGKRELTVFWSIRPLRKRNESPLLARA